ncbi:molybdenum cofactor guanylyltransferase [Gaiella sp.]|uniref:molybdenum cofactor guanylyltransferase n=1 Tax=Gaiella sp. TaxID=2663207 RepID=UPI003982D993
MRVGAIVLAGGRSSRMGQAKALLDWHGVTAVEHAVSVVRVGVGGGPVCVVRAPGQELPPLDAILVEDTIAYEGPLAALHTGLVALEGVADIAFACGVDTPLLGPAFVRAVVRALRKGDDAVVPTIGGRSQPLLAAYRVRIVPRVQALLDDGAGGLKDIPRTCAVRQVGEWELISDPELGAADPRLNGAENANTPEEWAALSARS